LILAFVGATSSDSKSLEKILINGYLESVKAWLGDILAGDVGGMDLLLHMLSNLVDLPVDKTVVKTSGMGKIIGSIEKHKICVGTPNESAIKERIQEIKDAWNASVKAKKAQTPAETKENTKRPAELDLPKQAHTMVKRIKTEDTKKSAFSSLLKKVSSSESSVPLKSKLLSSSTKSTSSIDDVAAKAAAALSMVNGNMPGGHDESSKKGRGSWCERRPK
jgi:hypothetical protein